MSLDTLDWPEITDHLSGYATSEAGRQFLKDLKPCAAEDQAEMVCAEILQARAVIEGGQRCFMESLDLFNIWHQRLDKGSILKPLDLKDVRHFCLEAISLNEVLKNFNSPWAEKIRSQILRAEEPLSAIDQLMTPEGEIRSDASETLHRLFRERASQARAVQQILDRLVKQHDLDPVLQDRYVTNREGRWVLPVRSGMQHHFEGIIHSSSHTKQTVFMEPKEIIPLNNRLREVEVEIEEEIERLLTELSHYLRRLSSDLARTRDALLEADIRLAQGQLASHLNAHPPRFKPSEMRLKNLRHPVLALGEQDVIPNDVTLNDTHRILLLSGPNAGGKTVLLKAVGLAAHMARCGLPICADEGSFIPFFEQIHVGVGDAQSIDAHLSTFAAHLRVLNQAAQAQGEHHLILIDEICGSTDPEEGAALARSFIETFAKNHVMGVVTSHLSALKTSWHDESGVINGSLEYDAETARPTYHFLMGVPGQSLAIQTARRVGVDMSIVERAMTHLSPEMRKYQEELSDVEQMKRELRKAREELNLALSETLKEKQKFQKLSSQFEKEKDQMLNQAVRRAEKKIDNLIERSRAEEIFKKHENLNRVKFELPEIIKASSQPAPAAPTLDSAESFAQAFPPGSKVFAVNLQRDAVVQGKPNSRGEVPILSNSMRLMVPWEQLKPPQKGNNPTAQVIRDRTGITTSLREQDRVIDLRGTSVEEALKQLESQLDTASVNEESRVKIIHGHGTDVLKKAVRTFLSRSPLVQKWHAGTAQTGGDGVTWAEL